jgi:hypothetical protein
MNGDAAAASLPPSSFSSLSSLLQVHGVQNKQTNKQKKCSARCENVTHLCGLCAPRGKRIRQEKGNKQIDKQNTAHSSKANQNANSNNVASQRHHKKKNRKGGKEDAFRL